MPLIRVSKHDDKKRVDININAIRMVVDNGQGSPADIVMDDGSTLVVNESAQSVRGYVKKAEANQSED